MKLTPFGEFVARRTSATPAKFWTDISRMVERMADNDEDWEHALHERIAGLTEYRDRRRVEGWPWAALPDNTEGTATDSRRADDADADQAD